MNPGRPSKIRLSQPIAERLLGILTSHSVPHSLFDEWPMKNAQADQIPEELRAVAVRYQRAIARAIAKFRENSSDSPQIT